MMRAQSPHLIPALRRNKQRRQAPFHFSANPRSSRLQKYPAGYLTPASPMNARTFLTIKRDHVAPGDAATCGISTHRLLRATYRPCMGKNEGSLATRTFSTDARRTPQDIHTLSPDLRTAPPDIRTASTDARTTSRDVRAPSEDPRTSPQGIRTAGKDIRTLSQDVRTRCTDVHTPSQDTLSLIH